MDVREYKQMAGKIACEYLAKYPDASMRGIASMLVRDRSDVFSTFNQARNAVRWWCGVRKRGDGKPCSHTPFKRVSGRHNIPIPANSDDQPWVPFVIPPQHKCGLVFSDLHLPYHREAPIEAGIDEGLDRKVDFILLNGDIWDCYWHSKFEKDPKCRNTAHEIRQVEDFLDAMDAAFPQAKIYWKEGNHERRYQQDIRRQAPQILAYLHQSGREISDAAPVLNVGGLVNLPERGVTWIAEQRPIRFGAHLWIMHGDEYSRGTAITVNPARTAQLKLGECAIVAHSHVASQHVNKTISQNSLVTWSMGCGCDLHPEYARINNWCWGYAIIERDGVDGFRVHNRRVGSKGEVW